MIHIYYSWIFIQRTPSQYIPEIFTPIFTVRPLIVAKLRNHPRGINTENVVYTQQKYFSHKEQCYVICRRMGATRDHPITWIKPVSEGQTSYIFSHLWSPDLNRYRKSWVYKWKKIILSILCPLHFHLNFRISLSISIKKGSWNFDRDHVECMDQSDKCCLAY